MKMLCERDNDLDDIGAEFEEVRRLVLDGGRITEDAARKLMEDYKKEVKDLSIWNEILYFIKVTRINSRNDNNVKILKIASDQLLRLNILVTRYVLSLKSFHKYRNLAKNVVRKL